MFGEKMGVAAKLAPKGMEPQDLSVDNSLLRYHEKLQFY